MHSLPNTSAQSTFSVHTATAAGGHLVFPQNWGNMIPIVFGSR